MRIKKTALLIILSFGMIFLWDSCKKDPVPPANPYDDIDYGGSGTPSDSVDANSIVGLHRNIFSVNCAVPGCHDGAFEPDFRTVESSWTTLVYHPVTKNSADTAFTYRVLPGDTAMSILHERITNCCFININDRMPQDNIGVPLPDADIAAIAAWIMNGAPDWNGDLPVFPNTPPAIDYYIAVDSLMLNPIEYSIYTNRVDSIPYLSFYIDSGSDFFFIPGIEDDSTAYIDLTGNIMRFSYLANDFSAPALEVNATYVNFGGTSPLWYVEVPTAGFLMDTIIYMRYYVGDGDNPEIEMPSAEHDPLYFSFWSFIVR